MDYNKIAPFVQKAIDENKCRTFIDVCGLVNRIKCDTRIFVSDNDILISLMCAHGEWSCEIGTPWEVLYSLLRLVYPMQEENLEGVEFYHHDILTYDYGEDKVIYFNLFNCVEQIDYEQFWALVRNLSAHNEVFVSWKEAPNDFQVLHEMEGQVTLFKYKGEDQDEQT